MAASPFRDPNLHLAVLDAAWDTGLLPPFEKTGRAPDPDAVDEAVRKALLATPLPSAVLEGIEEIDWGGGKEIQHLIVEMWDGEDDTFDVTDLAGIAALRNLRSLALGAAKVTDVSPLRGMGRLETFELYFGGDDLAADKARIVADLAPLLDLPRLKRLDIGAYYRDDEANRAVLKELQRRGAQAPTREDLAEAARSGQQVEKRMRAIAAGLAAFQAGDFAKAVAELGPYEKELQGSESLKLKMARKRAGG